MEGYDDVTEIDAEELITDIHQGQVDLSILATCFFARSANWVEARCGDPPHWTVSGVDYLGFRAGLIARYWDGSL